MAAGRLAWQTIRQKVQENPRWPRRGSAARESTTRRSIARLHVAAWRESYASLMPPEALSAMNVEEQAERWREIFRSRQGDGASAVFLAIDEDGTRPAVSPPAAVNAGPRLAEGGLSGGVFGALYTCGGRSDAGSGARLMGVMAKHLDRRGLFQRLGLGVPRLIRRARALLRGARATKRTGIERRMDHFAASRSPDIFVQVAQDISKLAAHQ